MDTLKIQFPWYAPGQFLNNEYKVFQSRIPQLLNEIQLTMINEQGTPISVVLSAVTIRIGPDRAKLLVVDNKEKKIYGHIYIDGHTSEIDQLIDTEGERLMESIDSVYREVKATQDYPEATQTLQKIEAAIDHFDSKSI